MRLPFSRPAVCLGEDLGLRPEQWDVRGSLLGITGRGSRHTGGVSLVLLLDVVICVTGDSRKSVPASFVTETPVG